MKKHSLSIVILILASSVKVAGQEPEFASWNTLKIETKVAKWNISGESELRYSFSNANIKRIGLELSASYPVIKKVRVGLSYSLIDHYDQKYYDYQLRHRCSFFVTGQKRWGDVQFSLSEKVQFTRKDESDRVKSSGEIDNYTINPEWTWRNKLKIDYNIPGCRLKPSISGESFYALNGAAGDRIEGLRYTLGLGYKLNKHHKFEINGILDNELNSSNTKTTYIPGIGYTFSF